MIVENGNNLQAVRRIASQQTRKGCQPIDAGTRTAQPGGCRGKRDGRIVLVRNTAEKWKTYGLTALLSLLTLLSLLWILKVEPFGSRTFLWIDSDQYLSIGHYFGTLTGKNDCFYTWNSALGGNALSQLAYYSASPVNVLFLFLNDHIYLAAQLITYIKILAASLTFCYCLRFLHRDGAVLMKALLSVAYAFMGYMVFYGWNASWMDGIVLLPVMYVGIIKVAEGRNGAQYILSLALAVISNFYIGYMLCLASVILYIAVLLLYTDSFWRGLKTSFLRYGVFSVMGGCMGMFILLPTYLGVPNIRKLSVLDMLRTMSFNAKPAEILSGLFMGQTNTMSENAPLIFVGVVPLMLVVLLFVCKKAPLKRKLVYAALLLLCLFSFENNFLTRLWHGLSDNSWFNYRYSFFAGFVLLLAAYEGYALIRAEAVDRGEYLKTGVILLLTASFVLNGASEKLTPLCFFTDLLCIGVFTVLSAGGYQKNRLFAAAVAAQLLCGCVVNGFFCLKGYNFFPATAYSETRAMMEDAEACIDDDSFYRMEKSFLCERGRCDGFLFDYKGISDISSTENVDNLKYLKKLGVNQWHPWGVSYTSNMPEASESLLGIKYLLTDRLTGKDYIPIGSNGDIGYYRNPNALPLLFPSLSAEVSTSDMDDIELQNTVWRSINGIERDVFVENTVADPGGAEGRTLEITVEHSGSVYLYFPDSDVSFLHMQTSTVGRDETSDFVYKNSMELYYVGEMEQGDVFTLAPRKKTADFDFSAVRCFTEDKSVLAENAARINGQDLCIEEVSSSHLEMTYTGDRKCIASSIPYEAGWRVYDNGRETAVRRNWDNFLSFELDGSQEHQITLIYRPVGFRAGLAVSLLAAASFVVYEAAALRGKRKQRAKTQESEAGETP